jgi:hypothetical protein
MPGVPNEVGRLCGWERGGQSPLDAQSPRSAFRLMPIVPLPGRRYFRAASRTRNETLQPFQRVANHPRMIARGQAFPPSDRAPSVKCGDGCQTRPAGRRRAFAVWHHRPKGRKRTDVGPQGSEHLGKKGQFFCVLNADPCAASCGPYDYHAGPPSNVLPAGNALVDPLSPASQNSPRRSPAKTWKGCQ